MKRKILVIEDDKLLMRIVVDQLLNAGYEVVSAYNGKEGLEKVTSEGPDLVLLDLVLPEMDGLTVLKNIKSDDNTKHVPVIMLTNISNMDIVSQAVELGVSDYLIKGEYDIKQLLEKMKSLIG